MDKGNKMKYKNILEKANKKMEEQIDLTPKPFPYLLGQRKSCISYWFPRIKHLPVPRTVILHTDLLSDTYKIFDGEEHKPLENAVKQIKTIIETGFGYPTFLRTGQTSNKHSWSHTCYVDKESDIYSHMVNLIEFSSICDLYGLPFDVWAIREFLELETYFTAFDNMPIGKEFRFFIENGSIIYEQPYWLKKAFQEPYTPKEKNWEQHLETFSNLQTKDIEPARTLAREVAEIFKDDVQFSVDICKLKSSEWYITDMAVGANSFRWALVNGQEIELTGQKIQPGGFCPEKIDQEKERATRLLLELFD